MKKETLELISTIAVGIPAFAYCMYKLKDKYVNWAEKNEFYDKEFEKADMELTD